MSTKTILTDEELSIIRESLLCYLAMLNQGSITPWRWERAEMSKKVLNLFSVHTVVLETETVRKSDH